MQDLLFHDTDLIVITNAITQHFQDNRCRRVRELDLSLSNEPRQNVNMSIKGPYMTL